MSEEEKNITPNNNNTLPPSSADTELDENLTEELSAELMVRELLSENPEILQQLIKDEPLIGQLLEKHPGIKKSLTLHCSRSFSGPIPSPETLADYKGVQSDFPERILRMAEEDGAHIREMQQKAIDAKINEVKLGQYFGLTIGVTAIISGAITAIFGNPIAGSFIGGTGVVGLVTAFIVGRAKKEEKKEKPEAE